MMKDIKLIPMRPQLKMEPYLPKKVAAYCRVSTHQEIQYHSLEAQYEFYEKYIRQHVNWVFAGIYSDQASGRHNKRMRDFQKMLEDCRAGKINLILVKSISRLGRNTVEFLQSVGFFNSNKIEVYFEVEKLYCSDPKAVKMLTIFASLYQQESETKSFNVRWGHHAHFADGFSLMYNRPCYGYKQNENGLLEIDSEQAAVVIRIFAYRSAGASLREIAKVLETDGIPAPRGGTTWGIETIRKILNNEKYTGTVVLGKTYVSDYFKGKQSQNKGESEMYVFEGHHIPIKQK